MAYMDEDDLQLLAAERRSLHVPGKKSSKDEIDKKMSLAAKLWVDMERGTFIPTAPENRDSGAMLLATEKGIVRKSVILREMGMADKAPPQWFYSEEFLRRLEIERVRRDISYVEAVKQFAEPLRKILGLSLAEWHRRLLENPEKIPYRALADASLKLMRLLGEFEGNVLPQGAQLSLTVVRESILKIEDPAEREAVLKEFMAMARQNMAQVGVIDLGEMEPGDGR